ncbi:type II toxin-antitoxin system HipA family toxin [Roseivirga sp. UBA1976]|uniref:type II toxin-antitoxin system HipA family toxin n=1 Tax=Roseivirga sp. UBA1976 TaxID=1947386 RepID=UPI00257DA327|nr:type II toxin-antitoxin system HipA family toxin [Roseivirga sp. UBA1976]|tara:strand:+ start:2318 stop:3619 length:1302 start_codon:yes stop_codon:yes gene_type:complete
MAVVQVFVWDELVGAVIWNEARQVATFQFAPEFIEKGIDLAPLTMPLDDLKRGETIYSFPSLNRDTYSGLPGLLSDSLPDAFGNQIIRSWLATQGRIPASITPLEKLSYVGIRGMGALEFKPASTPFGKQTKDIEVEELLGLTNKVLEERQAINLSLTEDEQEAMTDLIRVGTSAGGQRPKAIVGYNAKTGALKSGQFRLPKGFNYYLLKFDGVKAGNLGDPAGYGRIEMAYYLMAKAAGIEMMPCRLLEENGRAHFMTQRFDRSPEGEKIHMQTLCALSHYDFMMPGAYGYEDVMADMRDLQLPYADMEQMFLRMVFNLVARNQDDHTKNIAFLLPKGGEWRLAPAYDVTWAYNPQGAWTSQHQMSLGGKRDHFNREDLLVFGRQQSIKKADLLINQVLDAVHRWPEWANETGVPKAQAGAIAKTHRLYLGG